MTDTDRLYARKHHRGSPKLAWHIINFHTRGLNTWLSLCGRVVMDPALDELPTTGHACASCERIFIRAVDPS